MAYPGLTSRHSDRIEFSIVTPLAPCLSQPRADRGGSNPEPMSEYGQGSCGTEAPRIREFHHVDTQSQSSSLPFDVQQPVSTPDNPRVSAAELVLGFVSQRGDTARRSRKEARVGS